MCTQTDRESQVALRSQRVTARFIVHRDCPATLRLPSAHLISRLRSCLETNCGVSSYRARDRWLMWERQYRVARAGETEYRRVTDRYHNHTSPLIASTCWIKHTAFLPRAVTPNKLIQVHFTHSEKIQKMRKMTWENRINLKTNMLVLQFQELVLKPYSSLSEICSGRAQELYNIGKKFIFIFSV